jgi:iron complex outermembrane receptor protein
MAAATAGAAAICGLGASAWSLAETPAAPSDSSDTSALAEIVVTAQKRSQNIQDVPIAVSAAEGPALLDAGADSNLGLVKFTPSLAINSGQGFFSPYLRGVGSQYPNLGLESSIASYQDDLYLSRPQGGFSDYMDVERVEVLKGPQGTLFGRNAAGGAIRIISNDPKLNTLDGDAYVSYGRYNRVSAQGVVNVPMGDALAARLAYYHDSRDGYVFNVDPGKRALANRSLDMIRGKVLFEPDSAFKAKLTVEYSHKDDDESSGSNNIEGAPGQTAVALGGIAAPGFYRTSADLPYSDSKPWLIEQLKSSLRLDLDTGPVTVSSITGYVWSNFDARYTELDATNLPYQGDTYAEHSGSWSQEFQAVSNFSGPLKFVAGLYLYREQGGNNFALFGEYVNDALGGSFGVPFPYGPNIGKPGGGPTLNSLASLRIESAAPYAQITYDFTDQLQFLVGLRETWEKKTLLDHYNTITYLPAAFGGTLTTFSEADRDLKFNKFTPQFTLSYKPLQHVLLYTSFSEGFKSGGINTPQFGPADTVQPETLRSYEIGWKTEFGNFRFNGAGFYYDYKNLQVQRTDLQTGGTRIENAASAKIDGVEADITWAVSSALELGAGGGYTHSEYKDYLGAAYVLCATTPSGAGCSTTGRTAGLGYGVEDQDFSGRQLAMAPELSFNLHGDYDQPLPNGAGSLHFAGVFSYSDPYFYSPEHTLEEPSHELLSATVTWQPESQRYRVSVFGDNMLNRQYYIQRGRTGLGGVQFPAAPFTWGIRFGMKF